MDLCKQVSRMLLCGGVPTLPPLERLAGFREWEVDSAAVSDYVDQCQTELIRLMSDLPTASAPDAPAESGWQEILPKPTPTARVFCGYTQGVKNPLLASTCWLQGVDADTLFKFLVGLEGYAVIDPDVDHTKADIVADLKPYWRDRLDVVHSVAVAHPKCWPRSYMSMIAVDHKQHLMISLPVTHPKHTKEADLAKEIIRALNVWVTWIEPAPGGCFMRSLIWLDYGGSLPAFMVNKALKQSALQDFHKRLDKTLETKPELQTAKIVAFAEAAL